MANQNRFAEAVIAAVGIAANIIKKTTYPLAVGELAFSSDTKKLYAANSTEGGDFKRVHGLDMALVFQGDVLTFNGEILWLGE